MERAPAGIAGVADDVGEEVGRERILGRHLEDHGGTAGDCGGELMGREQDRKVERDDGRDRCEREAAGDGDVTLTVRGEVHRDHLAADPRGLFGALAEHKGGALDLGAGEGHGLAGFGGEEARHLFLARGDPIGNASEDGGTGMGWHGGGGFRGVDGGVDRSLDVGAIREGGVSDDRAVIRAANGRGRRAGAHGCRREGTDEGSSLDGQKIRSLPRLRGSTQARLRVRRGRVSGVRRRRVSGFDAGASPGWHLRHACRRGRVQIAAARPSGMRVGKVRLRRRRATVPQEPSPFDAPCSANVAASASGPGSVAHCEEAQNPGPGGATPV